MPEVVITTHPSDHDEALETVDNPADRAAQRRTPAARESSGDGATAVGYPDEPGLLDNIADRMGFRGWLEKRPTLKQAYRVCVGIVGFLVLTAGIVMIPFPGPGWLVVIAGLAILASEFAWAERLLHFTKRHVLAWTRWVNSKPIWVRLLIGLATAAFVYGVVVVMLKLTGIPGWVPDWVPLWR